jgi:ATP-binding protein involved in chromosome partitioning
LPQAYITSADDKAAIDSLALILSVFPEFSTMPAISEDTVRAALADIVEPDSGRDIVSLGLVGGLVVRGPNVGFTLEIQPADAERMEPVRRAAERAVRGLPGVSSVTAVLTAHRDAPPAAAATQQAPPRATAARADALAPEVAAIVAVASGKGGVGKSTTAVNLALALARLGRSVGILDADIYGPSLPRMMGLSGKPRVRDDKKLEPMENFGVKVMSMGFLVPEDTPMIWRGPMVMGALEQMLRDVAWGPLDVLVVDMPPGTGDAQLTMAQRVPLAGAVIVSTPQDIALLDARKGLNMFRKVDVPVFGIVENMSYFLCPNCGHQSDIFGHGGARAEAGRLGCDFLGEVPLHMTIRETSDSGRPVVASEPDGAHAAVYMAIAEKVATAIAAAARRSAPGIVMQ